MAAQGIAAPDCPGASAVVPGSHSREVRISARLRRGLLSGSRTDHLRQVLVGCFLRTGINFQRMAERVRYRHRSIINGWMK